MTAEKYVNAIVNKIKCGKSKKKEIKHQLLSEINLQVEQGEKLDDVLKQMGEIKDIVNDFNENISKEEKKKYSRNKTVKILLSITAVLVILIMAVSWVLPRTSDIRKSKYFDYDTVEAKMKDTIALIGTNDYEALQKDAILQMQQFLTREGLETLKNGFSDDWGECLNFGPFYLAEVTQAGKHFAVGEVTVSYENLSITYRLTYDEDMKLAGMYMR